MADRLGAPCPHCGATFDHQHCRLVGGPFDGQIKTLSPGEQPRGLAYDAAQLEDGRVVYPAPLPSGPFQSIRYRAVRVGYVRLNSQWTHPALGDEAPEVTETWPHRDDEGMLVYQYTTTQYA